MTKYKSLPGLDEIHEVKFMVSNHTLTPHVPQIA